jgi:hypothetical protein
MQSASFTARIARRVLAADSEMHPMRALQTGESSREFATFFKVSRYGRVNLPIVLHPGTAHFCLAHEEQRCP